MSRPRPCPVEGCGHHFRDEERLEKHMQRDRQTGLDQYGGGYQ